MKALLVVDVQKDFCPGGALPAPGGDTIIPAINALMERFDLVIASRDWHPEGSVHFKRWPVHCVQNSEGAKYHPALHIDKIGQELLKGTSGQDDGYSAFEATNVDFAKFLKENGVEELYITGIAAEFCVKASALDAKKKGFEPYVVKDAIKGVNIMPGDEGKAILDMEHAGIHITSTEEVLGESSISN
jgi:nicotinamidase/pyrazinamidase